MAPARALAPSTALLAAACVGGAAARELSASAAAALPQDDICAGPSSVCGLSALQIDHRRRQGQGQGWIVEDGADLEHASFTPTGLAKDRSHKWYINQTEFEQIMVVPDFFDNAKDLHPQKVQVFWDAFNAAWTEISIEIPFCQTWTEYFWPQMVFWTKEVMRRMDTLNEDDEESVKKFHKFAFQANMLGSILKLDPRKGAPWDKETASFFKDVAAQASTNYTMPAIPEFLRKTSMMNDTSAMDVSVWWLTNEMCDLEYWRKEFLGNKVIPEGEICWDEVPWPGVGYGLFGSIEPNLTAWSTDFDPFRYPEYKHCQEHHITRDMLDRFCPLSGHIADGVNDVKSWGVGPPTEKARGEVLECQRKMGPLMYYQVYMESSHYVADDIFGFGGFIDDGPPPPLPPMDFDPAVTQKFAANVWDTTPVKQYREELGILPNINPFNSPLATPLFREMKAIIDRQATYYTAGDSDGVSLAVARATVAVTKNMLKAATLRADAAQQPALQRSYDEMTRLERSLMEPATDAAAAAKTGPKP